MSRFCWAAHVVNGVLPSQKGVVCEIEGQFVPEGDNSYHLWCHGDYSACPTWRSHNADRWRDRETDIKRRREELIERTHGPADEVADSFMENSGATLEDVINTEI